MAANNAWTEYQSAAMDSDVSVEEKTKKFNNAVELSKTAYSSMKNTSSEYNLDDQDWKNADQTMTVYGGNGQLTNVSLDSLYSDYVYGNQKGWASQYSKYTSAAQHIDVTNGIGSKYFSLSDGKTYKIDTNDKLSSIGINGFEQVWPYDVSNKKHGEAETVDKSKEYQDYSLFLNTYKTHGYTVNEYYIKIGDSYYRYYEDQWNSKPQNVSALVLANASGTTDFQGGTTLINELGTEAIVTPSGTLTSLPAHTGIVPADLTKNLYDLGEIAPNLLQTIKVNNANSAGNTKVEDNSMSVDALNATFEVNNEFDFERLMLQARQYVETTKNR